MLAVVALAAAVGCAPPPQPVIPSASNVFSVPLLEQHFGTITATVVDHTGLMVGAQKGVGGPGLEDAAVLSDPSTSRLTVSWLGGVCRFGPMITLNGAVNDMSVRIQPEAGSGLPAGIECDTIGVSFAVELMLAEPVPQQAITVTVVR